MAAPSIVVNNEAVGGIAFITIDGTTYMLEAEARYRAENIQRKTAVGLSGIAGYTVEVVPPYIEGTFYDRGGMRLADFGDMDDVTVQLELVNGKVVYGANMHKVDASEVDAAKGTFTARFEGGTVREQTA